MVPNKKQSEKALLRELHFEYRMIKERNKYEKIKIEREIKNSLLQVSAYSMKGKRRHMEDFYDIGYLMKPADQQKPNQWPYEYFYFGVFDGHGGEEAASFAKKHLLKKIISQPSFWSDDDQDVTDAIKRGFAEMHAAMKDDMPNWSRTRWGLPSTAGTTASILFIKNGKFYTGHVGDSRIVISNKHPETDNWLHEDLTVDQKPENEKKRIESAGGLVIPKLGVHRVVWNRPILTKFVEDKLKEEDPTSDEYQLWLKATSSYPISNDLVTGYQNIPFLAIARSLGDFWSLNQYTGQYMVSPEPDVCCRPIDKNDKCILLATDGLWNVINSSQATRFLQELKVVKKAERFNEQNSKRYFATDNYYDLSIANYESNHALSLVYIAYQIWERRRLRSDNITAIVAMLGDILEPLQETQINEPVGSEEAVSSPNSSTTFDLEYIMKNTKQIGDTRLFFQNISLAKRAKFESYPDTFFECELLENLEHFLVFPPTVFGDVLPYVIPPNNYARLAEAQTRKLERDDCVDPDGHAVAFIYIKQVSDDPEDSTLLPTRISRRGVEVRDSSAQATQAMHDFGQPWDQLTNDQPSLKKSIIPRRYCMRVSGKSNGESDPIFYEEDSDDDVDSDEDYELVFEEELREGDVVIKEDISDEDLNDDEYYDDYCDDDDDDGEQGGDNYDDADDNVDGDGDDEESRGYAIDPKAGVVYLSGSQSHEEANVVAGSDELIVWRPNKLDDAPPKLNGKVTKAAESKNRQSMSAVDSARSDEESDPDLALEQILSVVSDNKTPMRRRSSRRSATENPKRKRELDVESSPKSKRRRSHPIPTVMPTRG